MCLKVVVGGKQLILALQLHATMRQFAIEFVELRDVLGKESRSTQQRKGAIHYIGIGRHGKGVSVPVLLDPQLLTHAYRHWL